MEKEKAEKKNRKNIAKKICIAFFLFLFSSILLVILYFNSKYQNISFPNLYLNQKDYGEITRAQAEGILKNDIEETYKEGIKLVYKDKEFTVQLSEIGIKIDEQKTLDQIFDYGKEGDLISIVKNQIKIINSKKDLDNQLSFLNPLIKEEKWKEISKIETEIKNFSYKYEEENFMPQETQDGYYINKEKLRKDLESLLENLDNNPIELELIQDKVVLDKDKNQTALKNAQNLIKQKVFLEYEENSWEITKDDLGSWTAFEPELKNSKYELALTANEEQIEGYLLVLVPQINQEPVNAQLEFTEGKVTMFALSDNGIEVNIDKTIEKISEEIFKQENYSEEEKEIKISLITESIEPEITTESIDNMGITSLLSTGESNFYGSTNSRKHNVAVGASKFNGILIGPDDEFSFNDILGEVGPNEGYLPELVIKNGQTIPEYGGGLCQVSTTAFRGAVNAGLEVTERKNHAYAVKYYSPQGTDATIYPPNPDLAFINNTPGYILIQTKISGNNLYFYFYGSDDGRKVELEGPVIYEYGEGGAMKTYWKETVYDKDGELFHENTFYSNYRSASLYPRNNPLE